MSAKFSAPADICCNALSAFTLYRSSCFLRFTNKIKQGETVKIQVEKTKITEPTEPSEDDTETTTPDDGDSTDVNAGVDSGSNNLNSASGN